MASTLAPIRSGRGRTRISEPKFIKLASALANAFLSGNIHSDTAAAVATLFPGASLVSISVLAGGKLLITEHNLVEPGYVKVSFDRIHQTVSGQAVLSNSFYSASLARDRSGTFVDLKRANINEGCLSMTSVPISQRQRSASIDYTSGKPASSYRRNSFSSDGSSSPAPVLGSCWRGSSTRGPPMGCLSLALPAGVELSSKHLQNLSDLAEALAPVLRQCCSEIVTGLASLFRQPGESVSEGGGELHSPLGSEESWSNAQFVEDYVDALLCRQRMTTACSSYNQSHRDFLEGPCTGPLPVKTAHAAASSC